LWLGKTVRPASLWLQAVGERNLILKYKGIKKNAYMETCPSK
jgi:hypothetical protein